MPLAENDSLSGLLIADTSRHSVIKKKKTNKQSFLITITLWPS